MDKTEQQTQAQEFASRTQETFVPSEYEFHDFVVIPKFAQSFRQEQANAETLGMFQKDKE